ncbi:restriction endonuclease subunit S [Haemophilus haemolyticus]|uniref:restriction endonuclease subunit S n=1 Tax=Haemophilus TaxID=724 RepID=UPI000DAD5B6A|nr:MULTISPECIES: restriction endonuclease subunit S [Haemophilus]RDE69569.1 restriction endonuclease subunit S [Haemophilus haemolyticus]TPH06667.1 restriction endonuclease subunit S [Haemophilus haemolyticus]TPH27335.1 restriction endonuclease subunit S [Haemophilus haemolyticus]
MIFNILASNKNWHKYSLEEICLKVTSGGTPSRKNPKLYENGNINWVKTKELNNGYIWESEEKITEEAVRKSSAKLLPVNTILLAMYGATVGELGVLGKEMACNQACCALIIDPKKADYRFIFYLLRLYKKEIQSLATGAAQQNLSAKTIKEFCFYIPSLEKQTEIADILSELDKKIQLNTQINQTLEQIAQALFKSWFVDFDPVRAKVQALSDGLSLEQAELAVMQTISGKTPEELTALSQTQPERYAELAETAKAFPCEMVEVDGGEVPKGWELKALSDLGQIICGKTPSKSNKEFYGNDVPFIKIPDMHNQVFITQTTDNLSVAGANSQSKKYIPPKSICVSCIATVGLVSMTSKPSHTNQQINSIIPNDEQTSEFLYLSLKQPSMTKYLKDLASGGSATLNLNTSTFSKIEIMTPSKEIIDIFHNKVVYAFEKVLSNSIENKRLAEIRDLLLPNLLNGESDE